MDWKHVSDDFIETIKQTEGLSQWQINALVAKIETLQKIIASDLDKLESKYQLSDVERLERIELENRQLQFDMKETVQHYEEQLKLKQRTIDKLVMTNTEYRERALLAENLVFTQTEFYNNFRKRSQEDY